MILAHFFSGRLDKVNVTTDNGNLRRRQRIDKKCNR